MLPSALFYPSDTGELVNIVPRNPYLNRPFTDNMAAPQPRQGTPLITPPITRSGPESNRRIVIVMVGKPARGKSFLANVLLLALTDVYKFRAKIFNAGNKRRDHFKSGSSSSSIASSSSSGSSDIGQDASFFDPTNTSKVKERENIAMETVDNLIEFVSTGTGTAIGFFDATNSTAQRRASLLRKLNSLSVEVIFFESVSETDDNLVEHNIQKKVLGPDYSHIADKTLAADDFRRRIAAYTREYTPLGQADVDRQVPFFRLISGGSSLEFNQPVPTSPFNFSSDFYKLLQSLFTPRAVWIACLPPAGPDSSTRFDYQDPTAQQMIRFILADVARWDDGRRSRFLTDLSSQQPAEMTTADLAQTASPPLTPPHLGLAHPRTDYFTTSPALMLNPTAGGCCSGKKISTFIKSAYWDEITSLIDPRDRSQLRFLPCPSFEGDAASKQSYKEAAAATRNTNYLKETLVESLKTPVHSTNIHFHLDLTRQNSLAAAEPEMVRRLHAHFRRVAVGLISGNFCVPGMVYRYAPKTYGVEFVAYAFDSSMQQFATVADSKFYY